jgi:hypothetical protein
MMKPSDLGTLDIALAHHQFCRHEAGSESSLCLLSHLLLTSSRCNNIKQRRPASSGQFEKRS